MKTKIVAVLLALMLGGVSTFAQEHSKSHQHQTPAKTEKSSEMSKSSSEPCCPEMKSAECGQTDKKSEKIDQTKKETKEVAIIYTCPMHPEVESIKPGKCPKCGMDLIKKK